MKQDKKPRKGLAIVITFVFFILVPYLYITDHPFGFLKRKRITAEHIDSLQQIIPKGMYGFLFHNDSLKISLNSMANYSYNSKTITVYDSTTPKSYIQYRYNWNNEKNR